MTLSQTAPLIIWRLTDGKPGHENQSLGLVNALKRRTPCEVIDIPVKGHVQPLLSLVTSSWPQGNGLPLPDLIIGAGHRTHLHMLAAKHVYGGRTIVLMQPSLPASLFDLCIIPQHDHYQGTGTFIETRGVLNTMSAHGKHTDHKALIMIGGPSKHCQWDGESVLAQISLLTRQNPEVDYTLTTSRRTPSGFVQQLQHIPSHNLVIVPVEETEPGWVAQQLADSASAWISEDSVSMVYEALTAQVAVGLLNMPMHRESRIGRGINQLIKSNLVCRFDALGHYKQSLKPVAGFMEADRCSDWLMNSWLTPSTTPAVLTPQLGPTI